MTRLFLLLALFALSSCGSQFSALTEGDSQKAQIVQQLRVELSDLKQQLHSQRVEQSLLEEKVKSQQAALAAFKNQPKQEPLLASLEKRISHLEFSQTKTIGDLQRLGDHANQTTHTLHTYKEKLEDLFKIKGSLEALTKTLRAQNVPTTKNYTVQTGDSLGSIAKRCGIQTSELKNLNHLKTDLIYPGQQLKVPYDQQ